MNALSTQTDRELADTNLATVPANVDAARSASITGATPTVGAAATDKSGIPYKTLKERNPEYLGEFWTECRALYAGGARLLRDEAVMNRLFPKNGTGEAQDLYQMRKDRAFFLSYPGEIIDHLLAGLAQDPLRLSAGQDDHGEERPLPEWWDEFAEDVSPPGGQRQSMHAFGVDCLREMFITQSAWILVDLPSRDPEAPPLQSKLDEERAGLLSPYLCLMPSDHVIDWQTDDETGELEWVLCYWSSKKRDNLRASRSAVTERWVYWTRERWERYEHTWTPGAQPKGEEIVPLADSGTHPFGVVPMVRLQVPDGLYAMGKLHSPAREHFNKRCAVAHAENMSLFAVLYEFNGTEQQGAFTPSMAPISAAQMDPRRSVNQVRGQGYTQIRGHQDNAKYIGPDPGPFKEARESCAELMREMHRVMFAMALSANMDSAALQRSGDSKAQDGESIATILTKVGEILRDGFDVVLELVALVRKEKDLLGEMRTCGAEKFDAAALAAMIDEAVSLTNGVPMRSPTFLRLYLYRLYKRALGPDVKSDDLETIREELDTAVTAEALMMADAAPPAPKGQPQGQQSDDHEIDDDELPDPAEEDDPPPKAQPQPRVKRLIATGGKSK